jgi:dTDP-4-amino-4,6-dideoxygalactose transaminase
MIIFDEESIAQYQELAGKVLRSGFLSEGEMTKNFEEGWKNYTGLGSVAVSSAGYALWALCEAVGVRGYDVVVPTNTFMATVLAPEWAGARVVFADCSRQDLCINVKSIEKTMTRNTKAVIVVHVGGHIAFEIEAIADFCKARGIALIEDCAHAHGALYKGKPAGSFGVGGAYSFYSTKTLPTGEGGMVVSKDPKIVEFAQKFRNYGKFDYKINGFHGRMNELTAALGLVQLKRLAKILEFKRALAKKYDAIFENRVHLPDDMQSGYYKYIVFDQPLKEETGKVYKDLCHKIRHVQISFPEAEWVSEHQSCAPIWFGYEGGKLTTSELKRRLIG